MSEHHGESKPSWSMDRQNTAMWVVTVAFVLLIGTLMGKIAWS